MPKEEWPSYPSFWNQGPGDFPPETFKSRYKSDQEKHESVVAEKKRTFWEEHDRKQVQKRVEFQDGCALSPLYGSIAAIGFQEMDSSEDEPFSVEMSFSDDISEKQTIMHLLQYLENYGATHNRGHKIVGFNSEGFDWPFIFWRAIKCGIPRMKLMNAGFEVGKWGIRPCGSEDLYHIMKNLPSRGGTPSNLDVMAKSLGLKGKNGNGKNFDAMSRSDQEKYLKQDVEQTLTIARMVLPFG